jgi:hypothetical protein
VQKQVRAGTVNCNESKAPVGIPRFQCTGGHLFPLFQPELDHAADGGLGFRWNVRLFAARAKHPLRADYLHQSFIRAKPSLYAIRRPRLLSSIGHFAFPSRSLRQ